MRRARQLCRSTEYERNWGGGVSKEWGAIGHGEYKEDRPEFGGDLGKAGHFSSVQSAGRKGHFSNHAGEKRNKHPKQQTAKSQITSQISSETEEIMAGLAM